MRIKYQISECVENFSEDDKRVFIKKREEMVFREIRIKMETLIRFMRTYFHDDEEIEKILEEEINGVITDKN